MKSRTNLKIDLMNPSRNDSKKDLKSCNRSSDHSKQDQWKHRDLLRNWKQDHSRHVCRLNHTIHKTERTSLETRKNGETALFTDSREKKDGENQTISTTTLNIDEEPMIDCSIDKDIEIISNFHSRWGVTSLFYSEYISTELALSKDEVQAYGSQPGLGTSGSTRHMERIRKCARAWGDINQ